MKHPPPCPCGNAASYDACCRRWHDGALPGDAEQLMRSRYVAYVLARSDYLLATWHASTRPPQLDLDTAPKWIGLDVRHHRATGTDTATVEFVARYRIGGRAHRLHETSRFVREDGRWYYLDGDLQGA